MSTLQPGDTVRVTANPSRMGIMTNQFENTGSPRCKVLVQFLDGSKNWMLLSALEKVENTQSGPSDTIRAGRFGRLADLRAAVTFYRLSGKLANLLYSLNTTNTEFFAYQFKPVLNFLDSPSNGILIADEVGLGKTIEAGLIWAELQARLDARRLLVVCPAMLREKWKMELADRFGVNAEMVDASELAEKLESVRTKPYERFALIASMQGLRPPRDVENSKSGAANLARILDALEMEDPVLDLVIIDEAHYLRNKETQTNKLGQLLRPVAENMVLLSATPIQMRSEDLFNLLHLLDEDTFPYPSSFDDILANNRPIIQLRDKIRQGEMTQQEFLSALEIDEIIEFIYGESEQVKYLRENPPSDEQLTSPQGRAELADFIDRLNPLAKVVSRTLKRDVHERRVIRVPKSFKASMTTPECEFYSRVTEKIREYCEINQVSTGFILTIPQRQMSSSMAAACRAWQQRVSTSQAEQEESLYELGLQGGDEVVPIDMGSLLAELVTIAHEVGDFAVLKENDSKYESLLNSIRRYWQDYPGKKIVLFSFYKSTLHYLDERLKEDGVRSVVLHGGMDKMSVLDVFKSDSGPDVLLSSEVASEGVDLQFSSLLVNYDLPWNPMKIEQRIGRIDRIGQPEERILIFNFMYEDTLDERVYDRLLERLSIFESSLGVMEGVLGDQIKQLTNELLTHQLNKEQENAKINQTAMALQNMKIQQDQLEKDASHLVAHGEYIQNKVNAARELGRYIRGEDLYSYVKDFFMRFFEGTRIVPSDKHDNEYDIFLSHQAREEFHAFLQDNQLLGKTQIGGHSVVSVRFENTTGVVLKKYERIAQSHPLIRFITECHRQNESIDKTFRVCAAKISHLTRDDVRPGLYVYLIERWIVSGARDIERLEYCVIQDGIDTPIDSDDAELLVNSVAHQGDDWLGAANELDCDKAAQMFDVCDQLIEKRREIYASSQRREDADRKNMMTMSIRRHLEMQEKKILGRIEKYHGYSQSPVDTRYVRMEQGKLKKMKDRLEGKLAEIALKKEPDLRHDLVSAGVIRVY